MNAFPGNAEPGRRRQGAAGRESGLVAAVAGFRNLERASPPSGGPDSGGRARNLRHAGFPVPRTKETDGRLPGIAVFVERHPLDARMPARSVRMETGDAFPCRPHGLPGVMTDLLHRIP